MQKHIEMMRQKLSAKRKAIAQKVAAGGVITVSASQAMAAGTDFTTLTSAVDFSTVVTGILAVAAAVAGVYIVQRGASMILSAIRS